MNKTILRSLLPPILFLCLICSAGCWDLREINDSTVPITLGIDISKDKKIILSALLAEPKPPGQSGGGPMGTIVTTSSDYSVSLAARKAMLSLSRVPDWTHVQNVLAGENIVRTELPMIIDFMARNRNISPNTNMLIAMQKPPEDFLANVSSTGSGLKQLVLVNEFLLGAYVPITMGDFTFALMTPGIEPAVPQVILEETPSIKNDSASGDKDEEKKDTRNKRIVLQGTAVFKGERMVGSLNEDESRGYRWLKSAGKTGGFLQVTSPGRTDDQIALEIMHFSRKTSALERSRSVKMHIDIDVELAFYEESCRCDLLTPAMLTKLEAAASAEISRQIKCCIIRSQQLNSDILGWGLILQQHHPDAWKSLGPEWNNEYPFIDYEVKVKTNVIHTYLSNKSFQIQ